MTKFSLFCTSLLISALSTAPVLAAQENNAPVNSMLYPVHAEIKEVKNRTLEATVREHKMIIDQPKEFGADNLQGFRTRIA